MRSIYEMVSMSRLKGSKNQDGMESNLIEHVHPDEEAETVHDQSDQILGKPTAKSRTDSLDIAAISLCIVCFIVGIVVVANERVSWWLGISTYQLIILGFLLSIMNMCLTTVAPSFFLILEARFGASTLQNYEGILTNHIFKSQLSIVWRLVLSLMLALPLGLSVAYKVFSGGTSELVVNPYAYLGNQSYYGLLGFPNSGYLGRGSGASIFANATLPFLQASSKNGTEPVFPIHGQAYGFNHLILDGQTAAFLDIPQAEYINTVQRILRPGESWRVTASVSGMVAEYDISNATAEDLYQREFEKMCDDVCNATGKFTCVGWAWWYHEVLRGVKGVHDQFNLGLMNRANVEEGEPIDFSVMWLGFVEGVVKNPTLCQSYLNSSLRFTVSRRQCEGTWAYTRTTVRLLKGSCDDRPLPPTQQLMITESPLILGRWYIASMGEMLGLFSWDRNMSDWKIPSFVTAVAGSVWSRSVALYGVESPSSGDDDRVDKLRATDMGTIYPVSDHVTYIRPTMQKSIFLYLVLAVQPFICAVMVATKGFLYTTPIGRGFGLTSVLSGLDVHNLKHLRGAALSGELDQEVKVMISPRAATSGDVIEYKILVGSEHTRNGTLRKRTIYY